MDEDPPGGLPPFLYGPDDPNTSTQDLVTRQMIAAVQLDGRFANVVARNLLSIPHTAVWPSWSVDFVTLAKHARFSRERRTMRDLELCLWMLGLVFAWLVIVVAMVSGHLRIGYALFGILATGLAVLVAAGTVVWFYYVLSMTIVEEITEDPKAANDRLEAWPLLGAKTEQPGFMGMVAKSMFRFQTWLMGLREETRARSRELANRTPQREKPTQDSFAYLANLSQANVAEFNVNFHPFKLAGLPIDAFTLTVDFDGVNVDTGKFLPAFSAWELHQKLLKCVPTTTVLGDGDRAEPRKVLELTKADSLYLVSGFHPKERGLFHDWRRCSCVCDCDCEGMGVCDCACGGEGLCDDSRSALDELGDADREETVAKRYDDRNKARKQRLDEDARLLPTEGAKQNPDGWYLEHPRTRVSEEELEQLVTNPPEGGRVYAYLQKYSWRGHLVVGAAIRVYREPNTSTLHIEFDAHALPPLQGEFMNMYDLPVTDRTKRKALWKTTVANTPTLLFQSLRAMYMLFFTPSGRMGIVRELQAKREEQSRIDYGPSVNLRLLAGDPTMMKRYPFVDKLDFARVFRDRALDVIRAHLKTYGLPLENFDEQVRIMKERKSNYEVDADRPAESQPDVRI